jgi:hypothetical protein
VKNSAIDILEIPLMILDGTLFTHMSIDLKNAWKMIEYLIDRVAQYRGPVALL